MPRLGWTMESGSVAEWLKHDGDAVQAGEVLFTVETDKVAQEVEAQDSGILRLPPDAPSLGTEVPVGSVLAYLVQPGEASPFGQAPTPQAEPAGLAVAPPSPTAEAPADGVATTALADGTTPTISPRARRVAGELGLDWTTIAGSGRTGRIVERDVRAVAARPVPSPARVSPVARRVAQHNGVDVEELAALQPGGRITRADVEAAAQAAPQLAPPQPASPPAAAAAEDRERPMDRTRRIIADRMRQSVSTVASVTLTTEADATELVAVRGRIKAAAAGTPRPVPSYTDLVARLVALALLEHPWMNSSLVGDTIVEHGAVHMGIAVDTPHGLLVPVVRDAHRKSVGQIAAESPGLIDRARTGKSAPDELGGSTFTITNLGMFEIDAFTPIINLPECAILGLGRIVARQVVIDEDAELLAIRKMLALSLTFDHRLVDGGPAARFLQQVKRWVEQPYAWLTA